MSQQIVLARLRPRDTQRQHMMRDYTSSSGAMYRAGTAYIPSALTRLTSEAERAELATLGSQVEFVIADDEQHLAEILQAEMENRVRAGGPPVRAEVVGLTVPDLPPVQPKRDRAAVLAGIPPATAERPKDNEALDEDGDIVINPETAPAAGGPSKAPAARAKGGRQGGGKSAPRE